MTEMAKANWNPADHPRNPLGEFTVAGGASRGSQRATGSDPDAWKPGTAPRARMGRNDIPRNEAEQAMVNQMASRPYAIKGLEDGVEVRRHQMGVDRIVRNNVAFAEIQQVPEGFKTTATGDRVFKTRKAAAVGASKALPKGDFGPKHLSRQQEAAKRTRRTPRPTPNAEPAPRGTTRPGGAAGDIFGNQKRRRDGNTTWI